MAIEEKAKGAVRHNIILEGRARLSISGVAEVESFDDNEVIALTSQGNLIVRGSGLHIGSLNVETGDLNVDGLITSLVYEETGPSNSLWSRLFK